MRPLRLTLNFVFLLTAATILGCAEAGKDMTLPTADALPAARAGQAEGIVAGNYFADTPVQTKDSTQPRFSRKIVYDAHVELAVEDFSGVPQRVIELVKKFEAYVSHSNLSGSAGENRSATWTIRVPVDRFEEFVNAAKGLGEVVNVGTHSRDVSEEYYDVEARIRNKTKEEQRLLELLEERPGKLEDVIAIERELSRVREELERMQGRMRVLTDLTSLTTVELSIREIRGYQPPESPTLATRVRRSFEGSVVGLRSVGEGIVIGAAALAPWLPVAAAVLCPAYLAVRGLRRRPRD
jgi:hypothetical protein